MDSAKLTNKWLLLAIFRIWKPLIVLFIFSLATKFYFLHVIHLVPAHSYLALQASWGPLLTSLTTSFIIILILPFPLYELTYKKVPSSLWVFVKKHSRPLFVESLRVLTYVLLWSFLFILPGVYKQIRWTFVPFIVYFDPNYEKGDVDPLEESAKLSVGLMWVLTPLIVALGLVDLGFDLIGKSPDLSAVYVAMAHLGSFVLWCYGTGWLYFMYHLKSSED